MRRFIASLARSCFGNTYEGTGRQLAIAFALEPPSYFEQVPMLRKESRRSYLHARHACEAFSDEAILDCTSILWIIRIVTAVAG